MSTKMIWRKKLDPITKIVKEEGITDIINNYKNQFEEYEKQKTIKFDLNELIDINEYFLYHNSSELSYEEEDELWCDYCIKYLKIFYEFNEKYDFINSFDKHHYSTYVYETFYHSLELFDSFNNNDWSDADEITEKEKELLWELKKFNSKLNHNIRNL